MKQSQDQKKTQASGSENGRIGIYRGQHSQGRTATCEQVELRVHDLMDQRLPLLSDETVRNHITQCDECAELVVDFGALDDSLSQIPIATLKRLSALSANDDDQTHVGRPLHPFSFIVSIASLLLVMLTSGLWFSDSSRVSVTLFDTGQGYETDSVGPDGTYGGIAVTPYVSLPSPANPMIVHPGHKATTPADIISAVNFAELRREVEPYLQMTADLPGMSTVTGSVNATFWLLTPSAENDSFEDESNMLDDEAGVDVAPDLGFRNPAAWQLCCV